MLVITGTQRSGTTAVAQLFQAEGYDLGSSVMDEVGGLENDVVSLFYRDYLGDPTFPFDDYPGLDETRWHTSIFEFLNLGRPVIKFSFLCMNPAFIYIWNRYRPTEIYNDKFLVMYRRADKVVDSKARHPVRFSHDSQLLNQPAQVLKWNFGVSCSVMSRLEMPMTVMSMDDLINNFTINSYLEALDVDPEIRIKEETWLKVIDPGKVHV